MTTLHLVTVDAITTEADVLVVGIEPREPSGIRVVGTALSATTRKSVETGLLAVGATGKTNEVTRIPSVAGKNFGSVVAVGLGSEAKRTTDVLRDAVGVATRGLADVKKATFALPTDEPAELGAVVEGALLGSYTYTALKGTGTSQTKKSVARINVIAPTTAEAKRALSAAQIVADAVNAARDLVNAPSNLINPETFSAIAVNSLAGLPVKVKVLKLAELIKGGFGGIVGVGQGSQTPPALVVATYAPAKPVASLALVGKGITYDSGGLSIKTAVGMLTMKCDMSGAAAVLQAVAAIARLKLPIKVTGYMALAENMPSGSATRPGDVITHRNGATTEVRNTDAEGRLVLSDALVEAAALKPDLIVDIATLTGGQVVALGPNRAAVVGRSDRARDRVVAAAERAGEMVWPMPLSDDLRPLLESDVADYGNVNRSLTGVGSTIVGGLYLSNFVPESQEWAHIDMAGPAFAESARGANPAGGTGFGVRTLIEVARDLAAKG